MKGNRHNISGYRWALFAILCLFGLSLLAQSSSRRGKTGRGRQKARTERKQDPKRVYLVHADALHYDQYVKPEAQILNGKVHFTHNGAKLLCDSAHFYEASNSFEAFGNVKMYQGDTLSLFSDYAYYDGNDEMAIARHNVILKHRKSTLYTDSLNYDRLYNVGYFFEGGKLVDNTSTLTSDWGEYHTDAHQALFNYDVQLKNNKFFLTSDTLFYNTDSHLAHVTGPSNITSKTSRIYTEDGYYNTETEKSELFGRSVMKDEGKTMVGDSVYYDSKTGISEAFNNVIYTDSINKNMLTGDYCYYDDEKGYAMATKKAVAIDFSQKDTLYMHADTFKIFTFNINTDSVYRKIHAYNKVRAYRVDAQAVCDSLVYNSKDSCMTMYKDPILWNQNQQLLGEEIYIFMKDSTINKVHVLGQALSVEQLNDSIHFNQCSSKEMFAYFENGEISQGHAKDNVLIVYYPIDDSDSTIIGLNYTETTEMRMFLENRKMKRIWMPKAEGVLYPLTQVPPDKYFLPTYAWFDYVRPLNKDDIFNWRGKKEGTELKEEKKRQAPKRKLNN